MSSSALGAWQTDRRPEVDLARTLAVSPPSGSSAQAVANILLASYIRVAVAEFQAFCAELYSEGVETVGRGLNRSGQGLRRLVVKQLVAQTALARGNPSLENLRRDFARLGADLRQARLVSQGPAAEADFVQLGQLLAARNELAHGDERYPTVASSGAERGLVTVETVDEWLVALDRIARTVDTVVAEDLAAPLGARPW